MIYYSQKETREVNDMTITKTFEYKGQMINYLKKIKQNRNIISCFACFDCQLRAWTLRYEFK